MAPGVLLTVTLDGDALVVESTGEPGALHLHASSETEFFFAEGASRIIFVTDEQGVASSLVLEHEGHQVPARRVE
jgi:hypothetical protein